MENFKEFAERFANNLKTEEVIYVSEVIEGALRQYFDENLVTLREEDGKLTEQIKDHLFFEDGDVCVAVIDNKYKQDWDLEGIDPEIEGVTGNSAVETYDDD